MKYLKLIATNLIFLLPLLLIVMVIPSCEKDPGEGGLATITGKVYVRNYNSAGELIDDYFAPDEKVYIIYGDNPVFDDDIRTHVDGTYQFKNLYKGDYTIFAYSKCNADTCQAPEIPVYQHIKITKRGQYINMPLITIFK